MTNNPRYLPPTPLTPDHQIEDFECRSDEQTEWLQRHARQSMAMGTTKILVVTQPSRPGVVAFYAWCMAQIRVADAPARLRKGAGRYPQPIALLARLGVSIDHEGHGLGAALLLDVLQRTATLGEIGCRGLLVHAENPEARDFYLHLIPEFQPSPTDDLHLVLLMKSIRETLKQT